MPLISIRNAILSLDESKLEASVVKSLSELCPTQEDMDNINSFLKKEEELPEEEKSILGKAEQYYMTVWVIPRLKERLVCFELKQKFSMKLLEIKGDIRRIMKAGEHIKENPKVIKLLELVLTIGNFLNMGTFRGSAWGFRSESLLRLTDIRATNSKQTLVHYIAKLIEDRFTELKNIMDETGNTYLQEASRVSFPTLLADLTQVKNELTFIQQELSQFQHSGLNEDQFEPIITKFYQSSKIDLQETMDMMELMKSNFSALLHLFGEDPKTLPEEFFSTWQKFIQILEKALKDNEREKQLAEKAIKRAEAKEKRLQQLEEKKKDQNGIMDDILNKLKDGDLRARRNKEKDENEEEKNETEKDLENSQVFPSTE